MRRLRRFAARLWALVRSRRLDRDVNDEIAGHLAEATDDYIQQGFPPEQARLEAIRGFGGVTQTVECHRAARSFIWVDDWVQDVRYAARMLRRTPGFAAVAVLSLTLGIGANAAMFSVVRAVLLRPLPFADPDALVRVANLTRSTGEVVNLSPADFLDFQRETTVLARVGANGWIDAFTVTSGQGRAERVGTVRVTEGFFPTLGVRPALGRLFSADEDRPGGARVVLLTDGFWRRRFGADRSIAGRAIMVNAEPATVIGVLPSSFRHIEERTDRAPEMFMLYQFDPVEPNRGGHFIRAVGRLNPGRTIDEARAELAAVAARLERQYPEDNGGRDIHVAPLHAAVVGDTGRTLLMLLGAVGVVLLVACANLASLLLAQGLAWERELAVRVSLGASRARLIRQLLAESGWLATLGAAGGVLVAVGTTPLLASLSAAGVPRAGDIRVDEVVLAFTAGIALTASIAFGLLPALALVRRDVPAALKADGRTPVSGLHRRPREVLIAAEVALSMVLLVGAALLTESLWRLQGTDPGFAATDAVAAEVALPLARYPEGTQIPFYQQLEASARGLPGVVGAGAVNILPLTNNYDSRGIQIEDQPQPPGQAPSVQARSVTPGYFRAMGIPLLSGRIFDERDRDGSPLVALVSESMARRYWSGQDPIGRRITFNSGVPAEGRQDVGGAGSREVVGIVGDVKHLGLAEDEAVPMFYTPHAQQPSYHAMTMVVRAAADRPAPAGAIRRLVEEMDREVPVSAARPLQQVLSQSTAEPRVRAALLVLFAMLALLLASVGVYGLVGHLVAQRTHEIGVRLALGATPRRITSMLVRDGLRPVMVGLAVGVAGAFAVSGVLRTMLFGIAETDIGAYLMASSALALAGLVSALVPARRSRHVSAAAALRGE